jgi:hypothetical protein
MSGAALSSVSRKRNQRNHFLSLEAAYQLTYQKPPLLRYISNLDSSALYVYRISPASQTTHRHCNITSAKARDLLTSYVSRPRSAIPKTRLQSATPRTSLLLVCNAGRALPTPRRLKSTLRRWTGLDWIRLGVPRQFVTTSASVVYRAAGYGGSSLGRGLMLVG